MFANICNCFVISNTQLERNKRERERERKRGREWERNAKLDQISEYTIINKIWTNYTIQNGFVCFLCVLRYFFSLLARSSASSFSHQIFINMHKQTCSINSDTISRHQINTVMMLSAFSFSAISLFLRRQIQLVHRQHMIISSFDLIDLQWTNTNSNFRFEFIWWKLRAKKVKGSQMTQRRRRRKCK